MESWWNRNELDIILAMKNIGLIGLVIVLLILFGGYWSYRATMPEEVSPAEITNDNTEEDSTQFIQMKPDSLPPISEEEINASVEPETPVLNNSNEKNGAVGGAQDEKADQDNPEASQGNQTAVDQPGVVVSMTDTGFFPSQITVKAGTKVSFVNDGQALHWPASDPHPAHDSLEGFDAGSGVATGESYVFQFDQPGEWGFHDHLSVDQTGKIIVE